MKNQKQNKAKTLTHQIIGQSVAQLELSAHEAGLKVKESLNNIMQQFLYLTHLNNQRAAQIAQANTLRKDAKKLGYDIPKFVPVAPVSCCGEGKSPHQLELQEILKYL